ncbi:CDK-activating kinase assembly factor MAT1 [Ischnura elegans]|uniref:CDK-activating kinase assembly factor MAT1 n=1 Tax=Ischnura elegans TaxID=197161 RepID=UPI001ED8B5FD|nr:CDK-activating kinase assembly factor MAT1 [Ischnura elegans]
MDDQVCPRCKTTKYRNPSLKLMVNVCGHTLCESCVDLLFLKGSGSCPECNVPLRRSNFRVQLFEDPVVEKEVDIRKRILKDFNKRQEDFSTLREYNDYLEELETIIWNLTNNIDVIATNKRIEQFKRENREVILKNKSRVSREELELEEALDEEVRREELRKKELMWEEKEEKRRKVKAKEALIDELMFSDGDARGILQTFAQKQEMEELEEEARLEAERKEALRAVAPSQFSTGIQFGRSGFLPVPKPSEEGTPFDYEPPEPPVGPEDGPPLPAGFVALESLGYLAHVKSVSPGDGAGGFTPLVACYRALQEALAGLYHVSERKEVMKVTEDGSSGNSSPNSRAEDDDSMHIESENSLGGREDIVAHS